MLLVNSFAREPHEAKLYSRRSPTRIEGEIALTWQHSVVFRRGHDDHHPRDALVLVVGRIHVMLGQMDEAAPVWSSPISASVNNPHRVVIRPANCRALSRAAKRVRAMFDLMPERRTCSGPQGPSRLPTSGEKSPVRERLTSTIIWHAPVPPPTSHSTREPGQLIALSGLTRARQDDLVSPESALLLRCTACQVLVDGIDVCAMTGSVRVRRADCKCAGQDPVRCFSCTKSRRNLRYERLDAQRGETSRTPRGAAHAHDFISRACPRATTLNCGSKAGGCRVASASGLECRRGPFSRTAHLDSR